MTRADVGIIGGGIAGLTLGCRYQKTDRSVVVLEASERPGGIIETYREGDWTVELGPNTVRLTDELRKLLSELGLLSKVQYPDDSAKKRYIVRKGKLKALPMGPLSMLKGGALSSTLVLKLIRERAMGSGQLPADEPLSQLIRRRFGQEVVDYALNPFVAGVFAGDPDTLSARFAFPKLYQHLEQHGSILKGFMAEAKARKRAGKAKISIFTLQDGLERLPQRLADELGNDLHYRQGVTHVQQIPEGWQVQTTSGRTYVFKRLINTLPLPQTLGIQHGSALQNALHDLPDIHHPPMAMVALGYSANAFDANPSGFGFLVPKKEKARILGGIYASSLFPDRAPPGCALINVFIGGVRKPELAKMSEQQHIALAHNELVRLLGVRHKPVFHIRKTWQQAIPQYGLNHGELLLKLEDIERRFPEYRLLGNYRSGVGVPDRAGIER